MQHSLWNMYASIRNGSRSNRRSILQRRSFLCLQVLEVLYREGYINGFRRCSKGSNFVEIFFGYNLGKSVIRDIEPLSMPGRRLYVSASLLWKLNTSVCIFVVSTPKGVMSDKDCRRYSLGGELLCAVFLGFYFY